MSKASRQSIALLAIVKGVILTIQEYKLAPELDATILYALDVCEGCVSKFPETGNPNKNMKWMTERIHMIDDDLNKSNSIYSMITLTNLAHHIVTDLQECINDSTKLDLIKPVGEVIEGLSDQIDPIKDCFEAYEEADRILDKLYRYLEFSR